MPYTEYGRVRDISDEKLKYVILEVLKVLESVLISYAGVSFSQLSCFILDLKNFNAQNSIKRR